MGLLERGISKLEKKIRPPSENPVVILHFVDPKDGDQPPNRWWVEDDGEVVEFASEAEAVQYCKSLETPTTVVFDIAELGQHISKLLILCRKRY